MKNPKDMALMFYVADVKQNFDNVDIGKLSALAMEISALSLTLDISHPPQEYKSGEMITGVRMAKDWHKGKELKMLIPSRDNIFEIKIGKKTFKNKASPLYLMALMTFIVDKKSKGQLTKMQGFDYLKHGKTIAGDVK